jgi:hypothetical protein
MKLDPVRIALSADRTRIMFRRGKWIGDFDAPDLARKIKFYEALRDREGGKYADRFSPIVEALKGVQAKLRESGQ